MAPNNDRSTIVTPKSFILLAAILLMARVVTSLVAFAGQPPPATATVAWKNPASYTALPPAAPGKVVIYEFYANWSDPCKRMEQTALSNQQNRDLLEQKFLPIRITDVARENGKNPQWLADLEKRYRVFALPTLVAVDSEGEVIGSLIGNCSSLTTYRFLSRTLHQATQNQ